VCGDEAAPANLVHGDEGWDFLTCAVALLPLTAAAPGMPLLAAVEASAGKPTLAQPELPRGLAQNPEVGLLDLIHALRTGQVGRVRLDRGRGRGYCAEIVRTS
jgi:hypothetical protein